MPETQTQLYQKIKAGNLAAFDQLFHLYYEKLVVKAYQITQNQVDAEDIVQMVFVKFWTRRDQIIIQHSVEAYLYQTVRNRCIDLFRHKKSSTLNQEKYTQNTLQFNTSSPEEDFIKEENLTAIYQKIDALPPKCKAIFKLSRFEEMTYDEIATHLEISKKTVEYHISTALKILRKSIFILVVLIGV